VITAWSWPFECLPESLVNFDRPTLVVHGDNGEVEVAHLVDVGDCLAWGVLASDCDEARVVDWLALWECGRSQKHGRRCFESFAGGLDLPLSFADVEDLGVCRG